MSVILVGVDGSERSQDAVAFAHELARDTAARVVVASAFPYDDIPSHAANLEFREAVESAAGHTVAEHARRLAGLGDRVSTVTIARTSPAHGLQELAESEHAALIVVGSSHTGRIGRVHPGSTGERLLHGAPCAVAVVPRDFRRIVRPLRTIGVAWDGSSAADAALGAGAALAEILGAHLRVIRVADRSIEHPAADELAAAVAQLPPELDVDTMLLVGDPVEQLRWQTGSLDVLLTGSRGYGPLHAALVGGVSGRLVREAACAVIVVPRKAQAALAGLFRSGFAIS